MAEVNEKGITSSEAQQEHAGEIDDLAFNDAHRAALEHNPEHPEKLSWQTIFAVIFLGLSFVGPISCGFVLVTGILFPIGSDLGDTTNIVWLPGGWSVASSVSFSIAGSLSDIFGRRYVTISGQILVIVGAIVSCTAESTKIVAAGSTIIGFGCGIVFVAYAGIPELLPLKWRGAGLGWTELCMTTPWAIAGTIIANEFVLHATWRWCYYIAIIYSTISTIGTAVFYYPPAHPQMDYTKSRWQELKELDYIGVTLYATGLTVFLIGLTWADQEGHEWDSASVIAPIVLGFVVFIACFAYDWTLAKEPFFPYDLFKQVRNFTVLLVMVFVAGMIFYSMAGLLPQGSLYMFTNDPIQIGIIALPNGFGQLIGGAILPALSHKIKHLRLQVIVALVIQTLFVALYSVVIPDNRAAWSAFQLFGQGCFALITLLCYVIAGLHVPLRQLGVASGLIGTFRSGGGAVGNAIFTTILNSVVNSELGPRISNAALSLGYDAENLEAFIPAVIETATGVPGAFEEVPGVTPEIESAGLQAFKETYAYAFRRVFWATIPFGVLAIIAACFIRDPSQYLTNHTAVHMEKQGLTHEAQHHGHGGGGPGVVAEKSDSDVEVKDGHTSHHS